MADRGGVIVAAQPEHWWRPPLGGGQPVNQFGAVEIYQRVFILCPSDEGWHAIGADVAHGRDVIEFDGLGGFVIGGYLMGVRIFGKGFGAYAPADDHESRDAGAGGGLHSLVVGVTAGMRSTRGMTHQEYPGGVDADFIGVNPDPFDDAGDVFGGPRIFSVAGETITGVDPDDPMAGEIMKNIGVDLLSAVRMAVEEGATVNEHDGGAPGF